MEYGVSIEATRKLLVAHADFTVETVDTIGTENNPRDSRAIYRSASGALPMSSGPLMRADRNLCDRLAIAAANKGRHMARSFYYGTDEQLYTGSRNFARQIVESPETYGLSQEQADAYQVVADAYAAAYTSAIAPATRTSGAVISKNEWKLKIRRATASLAKIIDGTAGVNDKQKVGLGLSLNQSSSPAQKPGTPDAFRAELSTIGSITLKWKCNHPTRTRGVIYFISRQIEGERDFVHIGHSGKKQYVDFTVPTGVAAVSYRVQAVRTNTASDYGNHTVQFGVSPSMQSLVRASMNMQNAQAA